LHRTFELSECDLAQPSLISNQSYVSCLLHRPPTSACSVRDTANMQQPIPLAEHERLAGRIPSQRVSQHMPVDNNRVYFYNTVKVMRQNPHPIPHVSLHQEWALHQYEQCNALALARRKLPRTNPNVLAQGQTRAETHQKPH